MFRWLATHVMDKQTFQLVHSPFRWLVLSILVCGNVSNFSQTFLRTLRQNPTSTVTEGCSLKIGTYSVSQAPLDTTITVFSPPTPVTCPQQQLSRGLHVIPSTCNIMPQRITATRMEQTVCPPPTPVTCPTCMNACGLRLGLSFRKIVRMRVWAALGPRFPKENIRSSAAEDVTF